MNEKIKLLGLDEFNFSNRLVYILVRNNIDKQKLITMSCEELSSIRNMGPEKIEEIMRALEVKGYTNIKIEKMKHASKNIKEEYKVKLIDQILNLLFENSNLSIENNKMDKLIYDELKSGYEKLNIQRL